MTCPRTHRRRRDRVALPRAGAVALGVATAALVFSGSAALATTLQPGAEGTRAVHAGDGSAQSEDVGLPKQYRTVDILRLRQGEAPAIPWADGAVLQDGDARVQLGSAPDSFVELTGGYAVRSRLDESADTWRLDFVRRNGSVEELGHGPVSAPAASRDKERFVWTTSKTGPDGSHVVSLYSGLGDGSVDNPGTFSLVSDSDYTPMGYVNEDFGFLLNPEGGTGRVEAWQPTTDDGSTLFQELQVTAVSEEDANHAAWASFVRQYDGEGRPCTTTVAFTGLLEYEDQWSSCELYPISFSPDGRYAVAVDSRTDGLGPGELIIVDTATGRRRMVLDVEVTQQVAWEPNGRLLFDAWHGTKVALVRCTVAGACERATSVRTHDLGHDPRSPFTLPRQ